MAEMENNKHHYPLLDLGGQPTMTLTAIDIDEVKISVDAALEGLQQELRELNHQVYYSSNAELA